MGCCSFRTSSTIQNLMQIRVVDINGYMQDFDYPIMVRQLIGKNQNKQFVSTAEKLLSCKGSKPLDLETQLQPGKIYFLLPFYALEDAVSPMDYVAIIKKLSSIAKSTPNFINNEVVKKDDCNSFKKRCGGDRSWKPILGTIREKSFTGRSESELSQETNVKIPI